MCKNICLWTYSSVMSARIHVPMPSAWLSAPGMSATVPCWCEFNLGWCRQGWCMSRLLAVPVWMDIRAGNGMAIAVFCHERHGIFHPSSWTTEYYCYVFFLYMVPLENMLVETLQGNLCFRSMTHFLVIPGQFWFAKHQAAASSFSVHFSWVN